MAAAVNMTAVTKGCGTSHVCCSSLLKTGKRLLTAHPGISKLPTAASFVRPTRPADKPQSFIGALHEKYASENDSTPGPQIVISGKVAEEMGFDKIRQKLAQVRDLKIVIVDGLRVACATTDQEGSVKDTCPNIRQLDLSRNLLEHLDPVVEICSDLPLLRNLALK